MSEVVSKYRIYCITESDWSYGWGTSMPTTCYNDTTHTVNPESGQTLTSIVPNAVVIQEENPSDPPTGGHYAAESFTFTSAPLTDTYYETGFPFPVSMLTCQLQVSETMVGDTINFTMYPNTTVGVLTADAAQGDTTITVNTTVLENVFIGLDITLADTNNTVDCGRITAIDTHTNKLTLERPLSTSFSDMTTVVKMTRYLIRNHDLNVAGVHQIGFSKIGGGYIPVGIKGGVTYTNRSNSEKKVTFTVEHLF